MNKLFDIKTLVGLSFLLCLKVVKVQGKGIQGWAGPLGLYNSQPWVELQIGIVILNWRLS